MGAHRGYHPDHHLWNSRLLFTVMGKGSLYHLFTKYALPPAIAAGSASIMIAMYHDGIPPDSPPSESNEATLTSGPAVGTESPSSGGADRRFPNALAMPDGVGAGVGVAACPPKGPNGADT